MLTKNETFKFGGNVYEDMKFLCDLENVPCPWLFQCSRNNKIETLKVCDLKADCINGSDEKNCSSKTHFYCSSGKYINSKKVNDKVADCVDGSDENCFNDLIQKKSIRMYLWFTSIFGIFFNLLFSLKYFRKFWISSCQTAASCFISFVFSLLLLTNFVMSIVVLLLIISHYVLYPFTCARRHSWYSSSTCSFLGILIIFYTFSHSFIILYMSALRFHITKKPSAVNRLGRKCMFLTFATLYFVSLITALIPTFLQSKQHKNLNNTKNESQMNLLNNYIYRYRSDLRYFSLSGTCFPFFIQIEHQQFNYYSIFLHLSLTLICIIVCLISFSIYFLLNKTNPSNNTSNGKISKLSDRKIKIVVFVYVMVTLLLIIFTFLRHSDYVFMENSYLVLVSLYSFLDPLVLSGFDRLIENQSLLIVYVVRKSTKRHKEDHEVDYDMNEHEIDE